MSSRSITVYLDEPWYNALARQAKKEDMTVEEKLEDCLDALIEQLPERVRDRVSREVWEEHQRELEASRRCSVLRITQGGQTDHLLTEGAASLDALHAAVRLRSFLLSKVGQPSLKFSETLHGKVDIAPEVFREHAEELRQGTGHVTAALDIDLDRSEFSMLDTEGGHWLKYAVPDVLSALWHSQRNPSLTSEQQQTIFDSRLDGREIFTPEVPDMEEETSPTMGAVHVTPHRRPRAPPCPAFPGEVDKLPAGKTGRDVGPFLRQREGQRRGRTGQFRGSILVQEKAVLSPPHTSARNADRVATL